MRTYLIAGGSSGMAATMCYLMAAFLSLPDAAGYFVAMLWPILSMVFGYGLYRWIASERQTLFNEIGFLFLVVAFALVAAMISVQLAVRMGAQEYLASVTAVNTDLAVAIRRTVRLVDFGLDVAWDMFIGASLLCIGFAMRPHSKLGWKWGLPAVLFGAALIVLNAITFPWPPDTRGLLDIGPFIGFYIMALAGFTVWCGLRMTGEQRILR